MSAPPISASPTPAPSTTSTSSTGQPTPLGAQFHGLWADWTDSQRAQALDLLRARGVTAVRIDIGWPMIEPKRGVYDTGWGVPFIDRTIKMATDRGLRVLGTLWLTPGWANGGRGDKVLPSDLADYAHVARYAADRWRTVEAWEVWNEPNSKDFLSPPDPAAYTALLKVAYPAFKAGNPNARVVFGGLMYVDTPWLERAYAAGARGAYDVMAVHPYQGDMSAPPERPDDGNIWWMDHTKVLVAQMQRWGEGAKPIWFTEFGWSTNANTSTTASWERGVTESQQADYLVRSIRFITSKYPQVKRAYWYNGRDKATGDSHEDHFGLMRRDLTPKPALQSSGCLYLARC